MARLKFEDQQKVLRGTPRHYALAEGPEGLHEGMLLSINTTSLNLGGGRRECSLNCHHCGNSDAPVALRKLTLKERLALLDSAKEQLGTRTLVLPGEGDPMFDRHLRATVEHAHQIGMTTAIFNSAYLITEKWANFFKEHDVTLILNFSHHEQERYDDFAGTPGAFALVMPRIRMISQVYAGTSEELNGKRVYRVAFNTDVNATNFSQRNGVQALARELDFMSVLNYPWPAGEALRNPELFGGSGENGEPSYSDLMRIVFRESENGGFSFVTHDMWCGMEAFGLSIGVDGRLQQCPYRLDSCQAMGHIDDYKISDGKYDLKTALEDKLRFWKWNNMVKVCSLRHGGGEFSQSVRNYSLTRKLR